MNYKQFRVMKNPDRVDFGDYDDQDLTTWVLSDMEIVMLSEWVDRDSVIKKTATAANGTSYISFSDQTTGTVEGYVYIPTGNDSVYISLNDGGVPGSYIEFQGDGDLHTYTDVDGDSDSGVNFNHDEWVHWRIDFIKSGAVDFIINNTSIESAKTLGALDIDRFKTLITTDADIFYIDDLYFSWDGGNGLNILAFIGLQNNLIELDDIFYWGDVDGTDLKIYSTDSPYGNLTTELTYAMGGAYTLESAMSNKFNDNIYFGFGNSQIRLLQIKRESGSWSGVTSPVTTITKLECLGIWNNYKTARGIEWCIVVWDSTGPFTYGTCIIWAGTLGHTTSFGGIIDTTDKFFRGSNYNGDFWYTHYNVVDGWRQVRFYDLLGFGYTTLPSGLSAPSTWTANDQYYIWNGEDHILFTNENFYLSLNAGSFSNYDGVTDAHTLLRKKSGFNDSLNFMIWGDKLWEGEGGGTFERLQTFTSPATCGWGKWFTTGNAFYNVSYPSFNVNHGKILEEIMKAPIAIIYNNKEPFVNQYLKMYDDNGTQTFEGRVRKTVNDTQLGEYQYIMKSGVEDDLKVKVVKDYTSKTIDYIIKDILDSYCNHIWYERGTNANIEEFDSGLTDWTNNDGVNCSSTWLSKQSLINSFTGEYETFENVLKQVDANVATRAKISQIFDDYTICSFWIGCDNVNLIETVEIYEDATNMGSIYTDAGYLRWWSGSANNLQVAVNGEMYHVVCVFSAVDDDVDIYVNGIFNSTQSLANNITTAPNKIDCVTNIGETGTTGYIAQLYIGDSLEESMNTFCSISPLNTTTFTKKFNSDVKDVLKWAASYAGLISAFRPDNQLYLSAFIPNGQSVNEGSETYGFAEVKYEQFNEQYSLIRLYGGYLNGVQLTKIIIGEPNFGYLQDTFANITTQAELDALATQIASDKKVEVNAFVIHLAGLDHISVGTISQLTSINRSITDESYNIIKNETDLIYGNQQIYITDSYWIPKPTKAESAESRITQNEQNIAAVNVTSKDVTLDLLKEINHIGSTNATWIPLICENAQSAELRAYTRMSKTITSTGFPYLVYEIPLPRKITLNEVEYDLHVSHLRYNLYNTTVTDFVSAVYLSYTYYDGGTFTGDSFSDGTNRTTEGTYTWDHPDKKLTEGRKEGYRIMFDATNPTVVSVAMAEARYYYA